MIRINARYLFGQINSISPKIYNIKDLSVYNDFAFVNRMFNRTGLNIRDGINIIQKSDYTERKSSSYR